MKQCAPFIVPGTQMFLHQAFDGGDDGLLVERGAQPSHALGLFVSGIPYLAELGRICLTAGQVPGKWVKTSQIQIGET